MSVKITKHDVPVIEVEPGRLLEIAAKIAANAYYEAVLVDNGSNFVIVRGPSCLSHQLVVIDSKVTIEYAVEDGEVMTSYPEIMDTGEGRRVYCETCGQDAPELTEDDGRIVYKETQ